MHTLQPSSRDLWSAIYAATSPFLRRYALRLTGGEEALAEDLLQETYLRALKRFAPSETPCRPRAWLARTLKRLWIDHARHEARARVRALEDEKALAQADSSETGLHILLDCALAKLPSRERAALCAFYLEGYSTAEVGDILHVSARAAEATLRRARAHLKGLLTLPPKS